MTTHLPHRRAQDVCRGQQHAAMAVGHVQSSARGSPLESRVLLDVLAVLVQGGGPNALQLATSQGRLQDVGGIDGALRSTRADEGVHLINHLRQASILRDTLLRGELAWHGLQRRGPPADHAGKGVLAAHHKQQYRVARAADAGAPWQEACLLHSPSL